MKTHSKALRAGFLLAALIPFAFAAFAADPAKPDASVTPTPDPALHEVAASQAPAAAPTPEAALREIGGSDSAVTPTPSAVSGPNLLHYHHEAGDENRVTVNEANVVGPKETVEGNAVAVSGPLTVDGTVNGNAVAILGTTTINGTVHGNALAVLGNLKLGPDARVDGNAVSVGGRVVKDPSATVGGNIVPVNFGADLADSPWASSFWMHGPRMGRPLAIGPHLHLYWVANMCVVAIYLLLALIFPGGVRKCADTLELRPGITILTGFLATLGLPVLFILLCITVVGIPVALVVLPISIIASVMFGKAAVYSFIGRSIVGKNVHPAAAVLMGVVVVLALYLVPALGLALWFLIAFLGFACALTTLFASTKAAPAAGTPPVAPAQPAPAAGMVAAPAALEFAQVPPPVQAPLAEPAPPVISAGAAQVPPAISLVPEAGLPRAGFWIRMVALLVDAMLIGIVVRSGELILPALAVYGAVLWKLKGSTVGGIIFGLKVVRHDGRAMDWATAVVRALACFFSLIVIGLGFIWIAFDPEKQGWHDKIAGTLVVRPSKGVSLV